MFVFLNSCCNNSDEKLADHSDSAKEVSGYKNQTEIILQVNAPINECDQPKFSKAVKSLMNKKEDPLKNSYISESGREKTSLRSARNNISRETLASTLNQHTIKESGFYSNN